MFLLHFPAALEGVSVKSYTYKMTEMLVGVLDEEVNLDAAADFSREEMHFAILAFVEEKIAADVKKNLTEEARSKRVLDFNHVLHRAGYWY